LALLNLGDFTGAIAHANDAIRLNRSDFWAYTVKGRALSALGKSREAVDSYSAALNINYDCADAHYNLGLEWMKRGKLDAAVSSFTETLRINPASGDAHFQLGVALGAQGRTRQAVSHYRDVLRLSPNSPVTLNNLAWLLATSPDADLRNGAEAAQLAERACELTGYKQTVFIGTLATAYAEAGQFEKAAATAQRACDLAASLGQTNLFQRNLEFVRQLKNRQPHQATP
jgi:Flp pilus assembly protein TadD